jgi:amino acid adenylation domain-containing protein/non-ribosomal peptide synthase protein (TIGR01720 family)
MAHVEIEDLYPLSPVQKGMLFHALVEDAREVYRPQIACSLEGDLDFALLERALQTVVDRHGVLRTSFLWEGLEQPMQVVKARATIPLRVEDVSHLAPDAQRAAFEAYLVDDRARSFDLAEGPLLRATVLARGDRRAWLVVSFHHIVMDGWSFAILLRETLAAYASIAAGQTARLPTAPSFGDLVDWAASQDEVAARAFWERELRGSTCGTSLRFLESGVRAQGGFRAHHADLDEAASGQLQSFARRRGVTLATLVQAAWALTLSQYTGETDVLFGVTVSGRDAPVAGIEAMVGPCLNTLPLHVSLPSERTLPSVLEAVRASTAGMSEYAQTPLTSIQSWLDVPRGQSLFESIVVIENYPTASSDANGQPFSISDVRATEHTSYPITVTAIPGERLRLDLEFDRRRFDDREMLGVLERFVAILRWLPAGADRRVREVPALDDEGRRQVLVEWNSGPSHAAPFEAVSDLVASVASRTPEATAIEDGDLRMTYGELQRCVTTLARRLVAGGVGEEDRVGLRVERSLEAIVGILAILRAGAAYVPLDPAYPAARLEAMEADAHLRCVLSRPEIESAMAASGSDAGDGALPRLRPEQAAYVIYTSGSTGTPKGVVVEHRAVAAYATSAARSWKVSARDRVLQFSSLSFDASVEEIFTTLTAGATLVLRSAEVQDVASFLAWSADAEITILPMPTAYWHELVAELDGAARLPESVRSLVIGGERARPERLATWARVVADRVALVNTYGPTESTVAATHAFLSRADADGREIAIGRPVPGYRVYVLDAAGGLAPIGGVGELCVGGVGVARGYLGRPALTAERFVPDPHGGRGARMYRTGDLCRWRPDGSIEYAGRIDDQVKIRGFRIELGEIESHLRAQAGVRDAVVVAHDDADGRKRLVAYCATESSVDELRSELARSLPDYMVPGSWVRLESLPIGPNGKIDRRALPAPASCEAAASVDEPMTATERELGAIWREVLALRHVGPRDGFFALGGDSIQCIQVCARARARGLAVTPKQIIELQTLARVAKAVASARPGTFDAGTTEGAVELTPIQRWFFEQPMPDRGHWNQAAFVEVRAPLDLAAFEAALAAVLTHHDALRLRFAFEDGRWTQRYAEGDRVRDVLTRFDLSGVGDADLQGEEDRLAQTLHAGLSLERGPLVRVAIFERGPTRPSRLLITIHHLVVDGVSWRVLMEDLQTAYRLASAGLAVELPAKTTSFKAWSEKIAAFAGSEAMRAEAAFWLADSSPAPLLPRDAGGRNVEGVTSRVVRTLDPARTRQVVQDLPVALKSQVTEILVAPLASSLARWTGTDRVLLDLEGHGREDLFEGVDTSRTVGWFTSVYPVAIQGLAGKDGLGVLRAVKASMRAVPRHGLGYGLLRYLGPAAERERIAALPGAQVSFNYLGKLDPAGALEAFAPSSRTPGRLRADDAPRDHLIEVGAFVMNGELVLEWLYSEEIHERATIERLADEYVRVLEELHANRERPAAAFAPSDFPRAAVDDAGLAGLLERVKDVEDVYPLTPAQEGMLFHSLLHPEIELYRPQLACTLAGPVDVERLREAWDVTVQRHPVLRTVLLAGDGYDVPLQVVKRAAPASVQVEDLRTTGIAEARRRLEERAKIDRETPFDFSAGPLVRLSLVRLEEQRTGLVMTFHHALLDGWSFAIVLQELFETYQALRDGRPARTAVALPFGEFVDWVRRRDLVAAETFWRNELQGIERATLLPVATERPEPGFGVCEVKLDRTHTHELARATRRLGVTVGTAIAAAWALVLARYTGEKDVVFGMTVSGRSGELVGADTVVGACLNTIPVRVSVDERASVEDLLRHLQTKAAAWPEVEHTPLTTIQGWSAVPRGEPLFESIVVVENYPIDQALASLSIEDVQSVEHTSYPLTVGVAAGEELALQIGFDRTKFDPPAAQRVLDHLRNLVVEIASAGGRSVADLSMMSDAETAALLESGRGERVARPDRRLHELFEACVDRNPDAVAVTFRGEDVTFSRLDGRANALATRLLGLGVGPGSRVAICAERSVELVVAMLATLKAGAAYIPVDPTYPADRVGFMLADSRAVALLTQRRLVAGLPTSDATVIALDDGDDEASVTAERPSRRIAPRDLAYVLYTSGSTGKPKAAEIHHEAICNHMLWMQETFPLGPSDVVLQKTSISFDASVWEFYAPLLAGARLVMAEPGGHADPGYLCEVTRAERVTILQVVPSVLAVLVDEPSLAGCTSLRRVYVGGEALSRELVDRFFARSGAALINVYGPTETCVQLVYHACERGSSRAVPIGRPLPNVAAYVLDASMRPVPRGAIGELYLGGVAVGRGYSARPTITAERYVPDPFGEPGSRLYATGDLCRVADDGNIVCLGRTDHQLKLRGFRIELGEIASALRAHPDVGDATVVAHADRRGEPRLVAYVATQGRPVPVPELRTLVERRLPSYMVPSFFVILDTLPLMPNGKLDRRALPPPPEAPAAANDARRPLTPTEARVLEVLSAVLKVDGIGVEDDFFDHGGHSLLATQAISRLRARFGGELPLRVIFESRTAEKLAAAIDARAEAPATPDLVRVARRARV